MIAPQSSGKIALGVALMSLVLWGCDSAGTSQSGKGISIEPGQMQYTLDPDAQIGISIVNTSARTLYLPVCGPDLTLVVERFESGTWENYSAGLVWRCTLWGTAVLPSPATPSALPPESKRKVAIGWVCRTRRVGTQRSRRPSDPTGLSSEQTREQQFGITPLLRTACRRRGSPFYGVPSRLLHTGI
jgi:hypothetical protein